MQDLRHPDPLLRALIVLLDVGHGVGHLQDVRAPKHLLARQGR